MGVLVVRGDARGTLEQGTKPTIAHIGPRDELATPPGCTHPSPACPWDRLRALPMTLKGGLKGQAGDKGAPGEPGLSIIGPRGPPKPVQIGTEELEGVQTYKYLGLWLDNRLDWTSNTRQLYKKTQSRMYFLRRLRSFNICRKLLWMFYQSVVASILSYAVVCWGGSATKADLSRLEKLIRRASSVVGMKLKPLATVAERRTIRVRVRVRNKLRSIMDNVRHPLHTVIHSQRSLISQRLRLPRFRTNRLGNSFIPRAIRLFSSSQGGRRANRRTGTTLQ
ncbi:hypothetical protein D4764_11G0000150 [Takifugu flavidus]|uniref:Alkylated DNA repair protein AlkB homologue 8 N-terminal domain-containing protein n=1 Tax=Takifugu flavidus TaxID=433684 RepID=A0A5C6PDQ0_9TELE|nr:hypothetical protein D4764_11G0000150 [Takifugu flavidus]